MSGGAIGINTTTGTNTVNIGGAAGLGFKFHNFTSGNSSYITVESGDKLQSNVGGSGYYTWVTGGSEKVRIKSSGYVGIGTNDPENLLHVNGTNTVARFESNTSYVDLKLENNSSQLGFIQYAGTEQIYSKALQYE